jgi:DNA-binding response OmpR family regulator
VTSLEIRTEDRRLKQALRCWFEEFQFRLQDERTVLITDLDSAGATGLPFEITLSRRLPATLSRPFSFEELERAVLQADSPEKRLFFTEKGVFLDGKELSLSPLELRLLALLDGADRPLSGEELSLMLFGKERTSNQINVYIRYLRKKTDLEGKERLIHTLHGKGFYLKNDKRTIQTS